MLKDKLKEELLEKFILLNKTKQNEILFIGHHRIFIFVNNCIEIDRKVEDHTYRVIRYEIDNHFSITHRFRDPKGTNYEYPPNKVTKSWESLIVSELKHWIKILNIIEDHVLREKLLCS